MKTKNITLDNEKLKDLKTEEFQEYMEKQLAEGAEIEITIKKDVPDTGLKIMSRARKKACAWWVLIC